MEKDFRIADTLTYSLARLIGEEQKSVKTTAFDLQMNPASPGMSFHKLDPNVTEQQSYVFHARAQWSSWERHGSIR